MNKEKKTRELPTINEIADMELFNPNVSMSSFENEKQIEQC